ncbi:MAG: PKD domain-containing protein [Limisphaerales bacterium]
MKRNLQFCFLLCAAYGGLQSELIATDRYVSPVGAHQPPFTDWASAATNIQAAIDVSAAGDKVWVTNGLYDTGGRIVAGGSLSNRVALTTAVTVGSVNGPEATIIAGGQTPVSINGPASARCAWLTNGATLSGFTLTNGATLAVVSDFSGGGAYCRAPSATLTNCIIWGNSAAGNGGGVCQGTLCNCVILSNTAILGGGAYNAWLGGCVASGNHASSGGGLYCPSNQVTISNCTLVGNSASTSGGGAYQGTISGCIVTGNSSSQGAGVYGGQVWSSLIATNSGDGVRSASVHNCRLVNNTGGGATFSTVQGSLLMCNTPYGASSSTNLNCTLVGNDTAVYGGGSTNCIIWFNTHPSASGNKAFCLLQPDEQQFTSLTSDLWLFPNLLSDGFHLAPDSPAIGHGAVIVMSPTDIDGQSWSNPPAIGCDEWNPQPLIVSQPRVLPGDSPGQALATFELAGLASSCWWTKDGLPVEDGPHYSGAHTSALVVEGFNVGDAGVYQVVASNSFGVVTSALVTVTVACVDAASLSPAAPYDDWSGAARSIQEAVDAAQPGAVVLVTNGLYNSGGTYVAGDMTNRLVLDKALTVLSMNGPEQTVIEGAWDPATTNGPASVRCAWVAEGAVLAGFTLRGGSTPLNGGGIWSSGLGLVETTVGCVVTNCRAGGNGGGAYQGRLRDCIITGNSAGTNGGGTAMAVVDRCLLQANSANTGGGLNGGVARQCRILANTASGSGGGASGPSSLLGCAIALNQAADCGGAYNSFLYQCTVVSNLASGSLTAGVDFCSAWNSIVYFNVAPPDTRYGGLFENAGGSAGIYQNICYSPFRNGFPTSITNDPQLLDLWHVATTSPCRGAGTNLQQVGFADIDGEYWNSPPAIGCDEVNDSALTGPLSLLVTAWPEVAVGGVLPLTASITGRAGSLEWSFGDGTVVADVGFSTTHRWTNAGPYTVTATAFNWDHPAGVAFTLPVDVVPLTSPVLTSPRFAEQTFSLQFTGQPGLTYDLQQATNLTAPIAWQTLQTVNSTGGIITVTNLQATGQYLFYRVQSQ